MRFSMRWGVLAMGLILGSGSLSSAGLLLTARLDGAQEGLTGVKGMGVLGIKLNGAMDSALVYAAFNNLTGPITAAHFHSGARGQNGPPAVTITSWLSGNSIAAVWTGFSKSTLDSLLRGLYYVNVHTAAHTGGEIRGQIELER